jgi:hypothetical protein
MSKKSTAIIPSLVIVVIFQMCKYWWESSPQESTVNVSLVWIGLVALLAIVGLTCSIHHDRRTAARWREKFADDTNSEDATLLRAGAPIERGNTLMRPAETPNTIEPAELLRSTKTQIEEQSKPITLS